MKKILFILTILFFVLSFHSTAQPNGGFENWSPEGSYENPDEWQTGNFLSLLTPPNPLSAFKVSGIDKHSGNYALKLKTVYYYNNVLPLVVGDTTGVIFTGKVIPSPFSYKYGFPYSARSEKLEFWTKYYPIGSDTGGAIVALTKWNGIKKDTIATGLVKYTEIQDYTKKQVILNYNGSELPDTAVIIFASSKDSSTARVGSTMFIDDVAFTGWVGINEQELYSGKVKTFPNPATDVLNILATIDEANNVKITDAFGKLIGVYEIRNYKAKINTYQLIAGMYLYQVHDKNDKILTTGKFNVIK